MDGCGDCCFCLSQGGGDVTLDCGLRRWPEIGFGDIRTKTRQAQDRQHLTSGPPHSRTPQLFARVHFEGYRVSFDARATNSSNLESKSLRMGAGSTVCSRGPDRPLAHLPSEGGSLQRQRESSVVSRYPSAGNAAVKFQAHRYQPNRPNPNYRIVWPSNHSAGLLGGGLN